MSRKPKINIVIKDGALAYVFSNIEGLSVEVTDLDSSIPDEVEKAKNHLETLKKEHKVGRLYLDY